MASMKLDFVGNKNVLPAGRRGVVHLKKSFKDSAKPSPPPSSDINFWPSLNNRFTSEPSDISFASSSNHKAHSSSESVPSNIWDQRVKQKGQDNQATYDSKVIPEQPIKAGKKKFRKVVDWFENDGSTLEFDTTHKEYPSERIESCNGKQNNIEKLHSESYSNIAAKSSRNSASPSGNYRNHVSNDPPYKGSDDADGWNIVKSRFDKQQELKKRQLEPNSSTNQNIQEENSPVDKKYLYKQKLEKDSKKKEEIRQQRQKQKEQRKIEAKFEREARIKLQRELAKRDTKVNIILAETKDTHSHNLKNTSSLPKLTSHKKSGDHPQAKPFKTKTTVAIEEDVQLSYPSKRSIPHKKVLISQTNSHSSGSTKVHSKRDNLSSPKSPEKKNVKTTDPVIFDILASAKKPEKKKPKAVRALGHQLKNVEKKPKPKRGKVRENATRKLSVLKKNILAERRARKEGLIAFLADQMTADYCKHLASYAASSKQSPNNESNIDMKPCKEEAIPTQTEALKLPDDEPSSSHDSSIDKKSPIEENNHTQNEAQISLNKQHLSPPKSYAQSLIKPENLFVLDSKNDMNLVIARMSEMSLISEVERREKPGQIIGVKELNDNHKEKKISKWDLPEFASQIKEDRVAKYIDGENWHPEIIGELSGILNHVHGSKFREYCDHFINKDIDVALEDFLRAVITLQHKHYKRDPVKARIKQRYYLGLKETFQHINQMSCIAIAPDIKRAPGPGNLDELVYKVINQAKKMGIPIVFGLNLYKMRYVAYKKTFVSCIGIINYDGAQEKYAKLMPLVDEARKEYRNLALIKKENLKKENQA